MNHINTIEIKNFKSIRHQKIEDCRRVNVFIGYPNTGKSNILEALSLFAVNRATQLLDLIRVEEDTTIFFNGFVQDPLQVIINNDFRILGEYINDRFILSLQVTEADKSFSNPRYTLHPNSSVLEELQLDKFKIVSSTEKKKHTLIDDFIVKKYEFRKRHVSKLVSYSTLQYPFGDNIFAILNTNESLKNDATELLKEYDLELLYDSRNQEFTILKRTNTGIFSVPYQLIADTLQRVIFYKAAILSNKEKVLLFEEPEAHMFPPYISKLTTDMMYDDNNNQYFIATHSPFVLNDFMENLKGDELSIYVVGYKKETGETIVRRLTKEELHEIYQYGIDLYFNLENYLMHEQK